MGVRIGRASILHSGQITFVGLRRSRSPRRTSLDQFDLSGLGAEAVERPPQLAALSDAMSPVAPK